MRIRRRLFVGKAQAGASVRHAYKKWAGSQPCHCRQAEVGIREGHVTAWRQGKGKAGQPAQGQQQGSKQGRRARKNVPKLSVSPCLQCPV